MRFPFRSYALSRVYSCRINQRNLKTIKEQPIYKNSTNLSKKEINVDPNSTTGILLKYLYAGSFVAGLAGLGFGYKNLYINHDKAEFLEDSLKGKTIVVTGATSGLGRILAEEIVKRNGRVIMASRSMRNLRLTRDAFLKLYPHSEDLIEITHIDLAKNDSVENCAFKLISRYGHIDCLVNNAGIFKPRGKRDPKVTEDGIERQFQVNFLGPYLLTELLKDSITERNGRVINILCRSMVMGVLSLHIDDKKTSLKNIYEHSTQNTSTTTLGQMAIDAESHIDEKTRFQFESVEAYMQSKLCMLLYTRQLGREFVGKNSYSFGVDPGASDETLFNRYSRHDTTSSISDGMKYPLDLFFGLFHRNLQNCAQTMISSLDPNKFNSDNYQGKVLYNHSPDFYDTTWFQESKGKRSRNQYLTKLVLKEGVESEVCRLASTWTDLETRKSRLKQRLDTISEDFKN